MVGCHNGEDLTVLLVFCWYRPYARYMAQHTARLKFKQWSYNLPMYMCLVVMNLISSKPQVLRSWQPL